MPYENTELHSRLINWSKILSLAVIITGALVLAGWQFDLELFKRPVPGLVAMNPLTAILFIISGITILQIISSRDNSKTVRSAFILPLVILVISGIKIVSIITGFDLPVDTVFFHDKVEQEIVGNFANRIAPNTVFNFFLTGITLLLVTSRDLKKQVTAQIIALIILLFGLLSLLGYLYKVNSFYGFMQYIPMAIHSSITFIILGCAQLFALPDKGLMRNFTSRYSGSTSARLLAPAAIIIPAVLGYLRLIGDWNGLYSKEFGVTLLILSIIILFLLFIWYNAASLNKKDAMQKEAENNLKKLNAELEQKIEERTREVINNEKRFRAMIENSSDIISLLDENNNVLYINPAIQNISGYSFEEIVQLDRQSIIPPEQREQVKVNFQKALDHPGISIPATISIIHKSGKTIWLEGFIKNMLNDKDIQAIVTNYRNITEKKEAELKAIESEQKIWDTLDRMMEGIQIIDNSWKYVYVNEAVAKQGKYNKDQLLGHTMMEMYPGIEDSKLFKVIEKCMADKTPAFIENEFIYNDGSKGWFELSIQPVPEGVFILSIDITRRKAAETAIRDLNAQLEQRVSERTAQLEAVNKELESFSYSVSHDLRAPLRAVNGYAKMIEEDYTNILDDEGKRLLDTIQYNARRMGTLIDDLLAFSRLGKKELQKSNINVAELIEATINDHNKVVNHRAEIRKENLNNILADYALISQVFYNLISNAVKYSSKKEKPVVTISSELTGSEVIYKISDNGAGFDMKYGHKLFGVFQRLHANDEFEGTGVGLAIVQRIINKHGGRVWAEGKLNEGATFYFSLPLNYN